MIYFKYIFPWLFIALILAAILIRIFLTPKLDQKRILKYFRQSKPDLKINGITWKPFGPGWLGANGIRIYEVSCIDVNQNDEKKFFAKTGYLANVYVTEEGP